MALPGDGKIVAVGFGDASGAFNFALARYNADGTLDASFSGDGRQTTNFGGSDLASGVAIQADGNVVVAGWGRGINGTTDFALARYLGG